MKFISIHIKGFMSLGDVKLGLADRGLLLVLGKNTDSTSASSNGAGKSAIFDALAWCLFGQTIRGISGDEIISRASKECYVRVALKDSKGRDWLVIRSRGSQQKLFLRMGLDDVSAATVTETQGKIIGMLGFTFDSFVSSVFFGQESLRFAKFTDKNQKAVLEGLLSLTQYDEACKAVREQLGKAKLASQFHETDYTRAKVRLQEARDELQKIKGRQHEEANRMRQESSKCSSSLRELTERLEESNQLVEHISERSNQYRRCQEEIQVLEGSKNRLESKLKVICSDIKKAIEISNAIKSGKSSCPTCGQAIRDEVKKKKILYEQERIINAGEIRNRELSKLYFSKVERIKILDAKSRKYADAEKKRVFALQDQTKIETRIASIKAELKMMKRHQGMEEETLSDLRKKIRLSKKELRANKHLSIRVKKEVRMLEFWEKGFGQSGIRSYLLDNVVPYLNERANYYSSILTGSSVRIVFSTVTRLRTGAVVEKFNVETKTKSNAKVYLGNSEGEKQRIDLCIALALQDLVRSRTRCNLNFMVFDEAFERLDEIGCEKVIELLNKEKSRWESCFVITHNDSLKQFFHDKIELVKRNGITEVA